MDSTRSGRWLALIVLAGLAMIGLSFVPGWLLHVRNIGGHGLTHLDTPLNAWELRSVPVLSAGVVISGLAALLAAWQMASGRPAGRDERIMPFAAALAGLALLVASAWPISQASHASGVELSAGWPLLAAIGLGLLMTAAGATARAPSPRVLGGAVALAVLLGGAGVGGRIIGLNLAEGTGRHYADGTYTRTAADGQPTETLTIRNGTFSVGDRWSGAFEGEGLVVALTDDPACPDVRGSYRVFGVPGTDDLRWEAIVDTCAGGERTADLATGTWVRDR